MIGATLAAIVLLAQAAPAAAAATPDAAAPVAAAAPAKGPKVNKDGLVCHSEQVLGSRIPTRVCVTPQDAADRAQQDKMNLERMQGQMGYRAN